jgi:hypothetical protein
MTRSQTVEFAPTSHPDHERVASADGSRRAREPSLVRRQNTVDPVNEERSKYNRFEFPVLQ